MAKEWTRQKVNQVVVLRIQGTKVRPPCKNSHLHHLCHLCNGLLCWNNKPFCTWSVNKPAGKSVHGPIRHILGSEGLNMPGQLNLSNPHLPQQKSLPQITFHNATQLLNTHLPMKFSSSPNRNVNPQPVIAPHHLVNSHVPIIPPSIAPQVPTLNRPAQNPVCSPQAHPLPCTNAPKLPLIRNPDLNLWRFPLKKPPNVNPVSNNATSLNNFQLILPPTTANPAISHAISQSTAPQNVNSNHAATCINQIKPFSKATIMDPPFVTPIIPPMHGHTAMHGRCVGVHGRWGPAMHGPCVWVAHCIYRLRRQLLKTQASLRR